MGNIRTIAEAGDKLHRLSGEVRIDARHVQEININDRKDLVAGLDSVLRVDPQLAKQVGDFHTRGVFPVYRGVDPDTPRVRGFPYKPGQSLYIISKLWNDVRAGRILVCATQTVAEFDHIICAPSTLATKKLPGRTISTEMRLISDVRLVNNFCDKTDYPACENPSLADLAQRVEALDRNFPGVPRKTTKRDVNEPFKRVATRPDCAAIFRTEFPGSEIGVPYDVIFF